MPGDMTRAPDHSAPVPAERLNRDFIATRLAEAAHAHAVRGDDGAAAGRVQAAVLVPLVQRPDGLTVLLTQRTAHLNDHAGQISFPGGRVEAGDLSRSATALREAEEEVGLPLDRVEILGVLSDYHTVTGFSVTPVVGHVLPPFDLKPDEFEVAEVFEVPLAFLMDPANHERHTTLYKGEPRTYFAMPYQGRFIWGATAGMLMNLYRTLVA